MISDAEIEQLCARENINIVVACFPCENPDEHVVLNHDGSYTIFINDRCSCVQKFYALRHALEHITRNDFGKCCVQEIEAFAHSA